MPGTGEIARSPLRRRVINQRVAPGPGRAGLRDERRQRPRGEDRVVFMEPRVLQQREQARGAINAAPGAPVGTCRGSSIGFSAWSDK
ncbi:MAG: hypothetical protein WDO13_08820 [Verrucomicrobiota bacterium]